jgi:hypothetical protein
MPFQWSQELFGLKEYVIAVVTSERRLEFVKKLKEKFIEIQKGG